jgi:DNA-binding beta-propeller fold protein YncE
MKAIRLITAALTISGCSSAAWTPQSPMLSQLGKTHVSGRLANDRSYLYVANTSIPVAHGFRIELLLRNDPGKGIVSSFHRRISEPDGIFLDSSRLLYVANADESLNDKITVYENGRPRPIRVYAGIGCAFDVVAGTDGWVYVADACGGHGNNGRVIEYPPGSTKPAHYLYPGGSPYCLTLDAENNLYVGYNTQLRYVGQVKRYRPGAQHGEDLVPANTLYFVTGLALDERGALLVANAGVIDVFTQKRQPPSRVIKTGQGGDFNFALDRREGRIYVSYPCRSGGLRPETSSGCGKRANTVVALDYATGKRLWTLREPLWTPMGVAVWPAAPFGPPLR